MTLNSSNNFRARLVWSIATGLIAGLTALATAALFTRDNSDWAILMPAAAIATFLVTVMGTWLLLSYLHPVRVWKGIAVGFIAGLLAHPLTWYLTSLYLYLTGATSSLGDSTLNPVEAIGGTLIFSLFSLAFAGWISIPISAITGGLVAYFYQKKSKS